MAIPVRIDCIAKDHRFDEHHCITHVGGVLANGNRWMETLDRAVQGVLTGEWSFYTQVNNRIAQVHVARSSRTGHLFLTTAPDGYLPNNLLHLNACPYRAA
jgi:hypothetical protein